MNVVATLVRAWSDVGNHHLAAVAIRMIPTVERPAFLRPVRPATVAAELAKSFGDAIPKVLASSATAKFYTHFSDYPNLI